MEITIRNARTDDAAKLSQIAVAAKKHWNYPDAWFTLWGDMLEISADFINTHYVRVAQRNNTILGFIALGFNQDMAEIEHLWVAPDFINQGVGKRLLTQALGYCESRGISTLRIESDPNAKGFYEKQGARQIGEIRSVPKPRMLPVLEIDISNKR